MFYLDSWGWAVTIYAWIFKKKMYHFSALVSFFVVIFRAETMQTFIIIIWALIYGLLIHLFLVSWSKSKTIKPQVK